MNGVARIAKVSRRAAAGADIVVRQAGRLAERSYVAAAGAIGMLAAYELRARRGRRRVIIGYHDVAPPSDQPFAPNGHLSVTPCQFAQQLGELTSRYKVIPLDELLEDALAGRRSKQPTAAITFDDAYAGTQTWALPLLRRHRCPATIFAPTGYVEGDGVFWWHEIEFRIRAATGDVDLAGTRYQLRVPDQKRRCFGWLRTRFAGAGLAARDALLVALRESLPAAQGITRQCYTWDELRRIGADSQFTIGSHGASHCVLASLTDEELHADIVGCSRALRSNIDVSSRVFSYPYGRNGDIDPRAEQILRSLDYVGAVTLVGGCVDPGLTAAFAVPRVYVDGGDSIVGFRAKVAGVDEPFWSARGMLTRLDFE